MISLLIYHLSAFEAFYYGSWQSVERLRIKDGAITMLLVDGGNIVEENVPLSNLRVKSRKATSSDCTCFLRPGLDVCVLSTSQITENSSEEEKQEPVSHHLLYLELHAFYIIRFDLNAIRIMLLVSWTAHFCLLQ